jgi:hypothetical protein
MPRIVECGCCGSYHRAEYFGDCRNDAERFASEDDALARLGVASVEVERFEYDDHGDVVEHFVETWPGYEFVAELPVE